MGRAGLRSGVFTGLVQAVGRVVSARAKGPGPGGGGSGWGGAGAVRLVIDPQGWAHRPALGDSISVSGCCLTVAEEPGGEGWAFDVIPETLSKTTLGGLKPGARVNLEHAVTASTLMGGHFVQGHVDGVGRVTRVQRGDDWRVTVALPAELGAFMVPKGSVCVEGVSLTIAGLGERGRGQAGGGGGGGGAGGGAEFTVALIPTTLAKTTLGDLQEGDGVNVEADMLAKTVVEFLKRRELASGG
jgi:riboflavin synthase